MPWWAVPRSWTVPLIPVQEQSTGLRYRGTAIGRISENNLLYGRAVSSYVTGAHSFKAGFVYGEIPNDDFNFTVDAPIEYRFNRGVPNRLTLHATPFRLVTNLDADHGLFAQDRWTSRQLTLYYGIRYDHFANSFPETHIGPAALVPNRDFTFPKQDNLNWTDVTPRLGAAYDLFGTGKTAIKASVNKYLQNADGYYVYGGRTDDMLKVSGIWVSPAEVEAALVGHPAVLEAAVVGKQDEQKLVKPKAYVVLKSGAKASEDELKAYVKEKLAPYKYPRWIEFAAELPKTATGKIQRFKLRA